MTLSGNTNPVPPGNAALYAYRAGPSTRRVSVPTRLLFLPSSRVSARRAVAPPQRAPERRGLVKGRTRAKSACRPVRTRPRRGCGAVASTVSSHHARCRPRPPCRCIPCRAPSYVDTRQTNNVCSCRPIKDECRRVHGKRWM